MAKIQVNNQSSAAQNIPVNNDPRTPAQKRRDTMINRHYGGDEAAYIAAQRAQASRGGINGGRPLRDVPGLASKAINTRWDNHRKKVGNEVIGKKNGNNR